MFFSRNPEIAILCNRIIKYTSDTYLNTEVQFILYILHISRWPLSNHSGQGFELIETKRASILVIIWVVAIGGFLYESIYIDPVYDCKCDCIS